MIKNIPKKLFVFGISPNISHPLKEAHNNMVYSKGDTTAGDDAIRYALNIERKAAAAVKPTITIYGIENSKLENHSRKIN